MWPGSQQFRMRYGWHWPDAASLELDVPAKSDPVCIAGEDCFSQSSQSWMTWVSQKLKKGIFYLQKKSNNNFSVIAVLNEARIEVLLKVKKFFALK